MTTARAGTTLAVTFGMAAAVLVAAPPARASAAQFCAELQATWDGARCTTLVTSPREAHRFISFDLPEPMLDNPVSGPVVRGFYRMLMERWRTSGADTPRDSSATADYQLYPGPGEVQSLIVHENLEPFGIQANNAYRSFVFDLAKGQRIALADLFKPGVDPMAVIPPATAPLLPEVLVAAAPPHVPNTYPFIDQAWQPGPDGPGYTGSYHTFGLSTDHLILYMPDVPMQRENSTPHQARPDHPLVWAMDGGTVKVAVPLVALAASLRTEYAET